jgi:hypothetical protein
MVEDMKPPVRGMYIVKTKRTSPPILTSVSAMDALEACVLALASAWKVDPWLIKYEPLEGLTDIRRKYQFRATQKTKDGYKICTVDMSPASTARRMSDSGESAVRDAVKLAIVEGRPTLFGLEEYEEQEEPRRKRNERS